MALRNANKQATEDVFPESAPDDGFKPLETHIRETIILPPSGDDSHPGRRALQGFCEQLNATIPRMSRVHYSGMTLRGNRRTSDVCWMNVTTGLWLYQLDVTGDYMFARNQMARGILTKRYLLSFHDWCHTLRVDIAHEKDALKQLHLTPPVNAQLDSLLGPVHPVSDVIVAQ